MTVKDVMDRVSTLYNDADYVRVSQEMYLKFLDDALMQLVLARPDSHLKTVVVALTPGTRQALPTDALSLVDVYRNKGQDGITNGQPVWQINRKDLDYFVNWHSDALPEPTYITEYAYDVKNPRVYWVSPPPGATVAVNVEMAYSYPFTNISVLGWTAAQSQVINCDDIFIGAIVAYILYLLYSTDSASKLDRTIAESYRGDFYSQLGLEYKSTLLSLPTPGDTINVSVQGAK